MLTHTRKRAFTLIELLVVIAIIAVLLAVILPSLRLVKETAKFLVCKTNLHQIGIAMHLYSQSNNERIFPGDRHGVTLYEPVWPVLSKNVFILGHLFTAGLLPEPTDNKDSAIYCPSDKTDWYHEGGTLQTLSGVDRTWQHGWMKMTDPVHCSYEFRDSIDGNWAGDTLLYEKCKGANIAKISRQALLTDWLTPGYMEKQHGWRFNYLMGDGSVSVLDQRSHKDQNFTAARDPYDPDEVGITGICFKYYYDLGHRVEDYVPYDAVDYLLGDPEWKIPLVEGETTAPPQLPWR